MIVFVSDLHMGDGGALEDFALWPGRLPRRKSAESVAGPMAAMHKRWEEFVGAIVESALPDARGPHELVLLGDVMDLLQVEGSLCDPEKIGRVERAHGPWFRAMERAAEAGWRISWVLGNHDHELLDPGMWSALRSVAPWVNGHRGGGPLLRWQDAGLGIHAEHGSQWDWANAVDSPEDPRALSLGSRLVLGLVNGFEPRCPLLDLMPGPAVALWYALAHAPGLLARPLRQFLFGGGKKGDGEEASVGSLDFLPEVESLLWRVWLQTLPPDQRLLLRFALGLIASALGDGEVDSRGGCVTGTLGLLGARHPLERVEARVRRESAGREAKWVRAVRRSFEGQGQRESEAREGREGAAAQEMGTQGAGAQVAGAQAKGARLHWIIAGHTHRACLDPETPAGGRRKGPSPRIANTGSWKARARASGSARFRIEQSLDALFVEANPTGGAPLLRLRCFG